MIDEPRPVTCPWCLHQGRARAACACLGDDGARLDRIQRDQLERLELLAYRAWLRLRELVLARRWERDFDRAIALSDGTPW